MTNNISSLSQKAVALTALWAVLFASTAFAAANPDRVPAKAQAAIPEHAIEKAPGLYYLGTAYDEGSAGMVEGYMIVHPRSAAAKPGSGGSGGGSTSPTSACYGFISSGAKWKTQENWVVDPTNPDTLDYQVVFNTLQNSIAKWHNAADGKLDGNSLQIFGTGAIDTSGGVLADSTATDGRNEVQSGALTDANTIAVTIVWGNFGGRPQSRQLVEWDQIYSTNFAWDISASGTPAAMDFESIATHELGHAFGLADLYDAKCSAMTMYGYGSEGQIQARTLEDGDINGMNALY